MEHRSIAYFSMEIAVDPRMPTYAGGLGVLAGDTIRAAADLRVPLVAVTLLYRSGFFFQRLDEYGVQREEPAGWPVEQLVREMPQRVWVSVERRRVCLRAWVYQVKGFEGFSVPVYFLDADLPENTAEDRALTSTLYGGDAACRLAQEVILGIGGVSMLRTIGHRSIRRFHMNEGHASLLTLALLDEQAERSGRWMVGPEELAGVRRQCVFTTHTPVPAGHDEFPMELANRIVGRPEIAAMPELFCRNGQLNLTVVGLNLSRYVNAVAKRHGEISRRLFGSQTIDAITNGVHAATWTSPSFQALFDRAIPAWRSDNFSLRHAVTLPRKDVWDAHRCAKQQLIDCVNRQAPAPLDGEVLTLGFARRVATYKRADLLFYDLERLRRIARHTGPFQVIFGGKAHPNDPRGKALIQRVFQATAALRADIRIIYLENYDMEIGRLLTAGCDVWLNTPRRPLEASGTSGMKAALNGVPSLSVLDGWWLEGHIEGVTGWAIGEAGQRDTPEEDPSPQDASSLYRQLEEAVVPLFYHQRDRFVDMMRQTIAFNGSFFNTQRMVQEYVLRAYFP